MEDVKQTFELSSHVVEINKLVTELNRLSRNTYKTEWYAVDEVVTDIRHHCSMIQRMVDEVRI